MNEKTPGLNALIKAGARSRLTGNYPKVIFIQFYVGFLIAFLSELFFQTIKPSDLKGFCLFIAVRFLLTILSGLFLVGLNEMYISLFRGRKPSFLRLVTCFYQYSNKTIKLQLLILLHILLHAIPFLITLPIWLIVKKDILLIPTGIFFAIALIRAVILQLNYSQVFYLVFEEPGASVRQLLEASTLLMNGNKLRYAKLLLSFIGLLLINLITFGIASLWIDPYYYSAKACFHKHLLKEWRQRKSNLT